MAKLPADDFSDASPLIDESFIGPPPPSPLTPSEITSDLAPLTSAAVKSIDARATRPLQRERIEPELTSEQRFIAENIRPGVPLYTRSSQLGGENIPIQPEVPGMERAPTPEPGLVSPLFRFHMARRRNLEDQLAYARSKLGEENARLSKDAREIIVTVPDPETGGKRDVTINDRDMNLGDLGALMAHIPEFAGALLGLAAARAGVPAGARPALKFAADIVGGAVGQEVAGAASDIETKLEDLEVVNSGEITGVLKERGKELLPDIALGYAMGGAGKMIGGTARFVQAPFSRSRTAIQTEGLAAAERLRQQTGIDLAYSPGQSSGFTALITGERYIKATPSGSSAMEKMFRGQEQDKLALFDALSSGAKTDEQAGRDLIEQLQKTRNTIESSVESARQSIEVKSTGAIKAGLGRQSGQATTTPLTSGEKLRTEIVGEHGDVMKENKHLFTEAYSVPGADEAFVPTAPIISSIKEIKLPMRTVEKPVLSYDAYGNPIEKTVKKTEPVREFLHPEVEQFLGTKLDPKMPLDQVVQMRNLLWDEIAQGEAVKGIPTRQLSQIAHSMTEAIDKGIADLPAGSELRTKLQAANEFYKKRVLKFQEAGIADIFKDIKQPGYIESAAIIQRLAADPGKYERTIKLLGPQSEGSKTIRTFIRDDLLRKSGFDIEPERIEAQKFINLLRRFREEHPDIYQDVIGSRGTALLEEATTLGAAQGSIKIEDARRMLGAKGKLFDLWDLIHAQRELDEAEVNQLIKNYTIGKLDINTINPEQLINGIVGKGTETDIRMLMDSIWSENPAKAMQIERKMTEKIFSLAGGQDATDETISKLFVDPTARRKYQALLGPRQWALVQDAASYLAPIRYADEIAKGTGALVKGSKIGKFFQAITDMTKPTKELGDIIKFKLASFVVSHPAMRAWVNNTPPQMYGDLAKAIVLSEPFIKAIAEDAPNDNSMAGLVTGIRKTFSTAAPIAQPERPVGPKLPADQF